MHRTQLYLDEARYQYVVTLAQKEGLSLAGVFRRLIDEHSAGINTIKEKDPFWNVIGIGKGSGESVAENYEGFLYGDSK